MVQLKPNFKQNDGGSILLVMLLLSVSLGLAAASFKRLSNGVQESSSFKSRSNFLALKTYIRNSFNCTRTLEQSTTFTVGESYIIMSDRTSPYDVLVKKTTLEDTTYTTIGPYSLRVKCAECTTCTNNKKLVVQVASFNSQGQFAIDPLSQKQMSWVDLFNGETPLACTLP